MKKTALILLFISVCAFGLDFFHILYHSADEPALFRMRQFPLKFAVKFITFLIPFFLLITYKKWIAKFFCLILLSFALSGTLYAASNCQEARNMLEKSGVARDASENFLGAIKVNPPTGSFPQDMDKITWWGAFKPFEFWESPEFQAVWIRPDGEEAARYNFRGTKCRLAKTTMPAMAQPRGQFEEGMWKVVITCDDYLIDKRDFAVLPVGTATPQGPESIAKPDNSIMIWANPDQ